jgi:FKBP-type peptidyl-prolyl cis-trans isomerase FklB
MKMNLAALALALGVTGSMALAAAPATAPAQGTFKNDQEKSSYALGLRIGLDLKGLDLDAASLARGIHDSATGAKPQLSDAEIQASLTALQQQMMAKQTAESSAQAAANQKAGDAYLAENAKKEGVKTTASGLQYKVIKSGTGKTPKSTDTVAVNYRGSLISGKEFDASRDEPATFPVTGVIPGWTEVLQLMKEGDKWQVTIPAKLAYGANGTPGGPIGPNEVLVFDVELVSIKPAK